MSRPTRRIALLPGLGAAILALGCADPSPDAPEARSFTVRDSAGIEVIRNEGPAWDDDAGWTIDLAPLLSIGTLEGGGPEAFGRIGSIAIDALDRLWIYDQQAIEIRVFSMDGSFVRTIGSEGDGPGEFNGIEGLLDGPAGEVWAVDQWGGRVTVFDTAGAVVRTLPLQSYARYGEWPARIDAEGRFHRAEGGFGEAVRLLRLDESLAPVDSIVIPGHPDGPQIWSPPPREGQPSGSVGIPYAGRADWTMTGDGGVWVAFTDRYQLLRIAPDGTLLRVTSKPFDPVALTEEERSRALMARAGGVTIDPAVVPHEKPIVVRLRVDASDRLWVVPAVPDQADAGRSAQVFDTSGVYLGEVDSPIRLDIGPVLIRDTLLVGVARDSLDVQYVQVHRIRGGRP